MNFKMKKTKIICTMGPNTTDPAVLRGLAENGMDVARFNFSHGDHASHKAQLELLKQIRKEVDRPIAALLDTKGPEIRTGLLQDEKKVTLKEGQEFVLTTREVIGDEHMVHINYDGLNEDVAAGDTILIDDGLIELRVTEVKGTDIVCSVINGGELGQRKGVNIPNVKIKLPALTDKDKEDIRFGIREGFDFIAASFVRSADAVKEIRQILEEEGANLQIIAKIENGEGIDNLDAIIEAADGIMVARGDMGVEIPAERVPYIQKEIIRKCNEASKPVITATQMLDSMIRNPRPTRAEVTDVANAVYDGTAAVMLSGETAAGKYPLEALKMMVHIVENAEEHLDYDRLLSQAGDHLKSSVSTAIGYSSVLAASNLNAKCIITPSVSGATTRYVSNMKPRQEILGVTPSDRALRRMSIYWGVTPLKSLEFSTTDDVCNGAIELAQVKQFVDTGDIVVLTAGMPSPNVREEIGGVSNMMRIATIE